MYIIDGIILNKPVNYKDNPVGAGKSVESDYFSEIKR